MGFEMKYFKNTFDSCIYFFFLYHNAESSILMDVRSIKLASLAEENDINVYIPTCLKQEPPT